MFFRKSIANFFAAHPRTSRIIAFIIAGAMIVLSLLPIVIIAFHGYRSDTAP
jgi:hypothetical protein